MLPLLTRPPALLGALLGVLVAAVDVGALALVGVAMEVAGRDARLAVFIVFGLSYAALGASIGALWTARRALRAEADALRASNVALADARAAAVRNETLAGLGRMAAGVAHEVRNPLGVMRSSAGLIAEDAAPGSESATAAAFIVAEVDRLDAFVRRVLDLARPVQPGLRPLALDGFAREAGLRLHAEVSAQPAIGHIDPDLLGTALLSLADNARQAGASALLLRAGPTERGVYLELADDGPGVAGDVVDRLFEPFFTTRAAGTGLGLAMAARVARAHDGALVYRPGGGAGPQGAGACFRFELPTGSAA